MTVAMIPREGFTYFTRSIRSLFESTAQAFQLLIVDGNAPWPIRRAIRRQALDHGFKIVHTPRYVTPNEARNIALALCDSEYIVFVDNDLVFRNGWLEALLECAQASGAALVGPLISAGFENSECFIDVHGGPGLARMLDFANQRSFIESQPLIHQPVAIVQRQGFAEPCELIELHCVLAPMRTFERIGPFDERLKASLEHVDVCLTTRRLGGSVYCAPQAVVHQLYPPRLPKGLLSLPYFLTRWGPRWGTPTLEHFWAKWCLAPDDPVLKDRADFQRERRRLVFQGRLPTSLSFER